MSPKLRPEMYHFSRSLVVFAPAQTLILAARPERTSLLLSVGLVAAGAGYVLGETVDTGLFIPISSTAPYVKLCKNEIGDLVTAPVWNGGAALLRASVSEEWQRPTGECECDDRD